MTDDFDARLRDRLAALAAAVPVREPDASVEPVVATPVKARGAGWRLLPAGASLLAVGVAAIVIASTFHIGPFAPGASPGGGPVVAQATDGPFELRLESANAIYVEGDPIEVTASLTFHGAVPIKIGHSLGAPVVGAPEGRDGPIGFGIDEPVVGTLRLGPSSRQACAQTNLVPGVPVTSRFAKSGSFSGDDPRADEYQAFFTDPELRLAPGTWHVYAVAEFGEGACGGATHALRADIEIVVIKRDGAAPTDSRPDGPATDTATEGPFSLELRADRRTYTEGDPIDVQATFTYAGEDPVTLLSRSSQLLGFGIAEPVHGMDVHSVIVTLASCGLPIARDLTPAEKTTTPFEKDTGLLEGDRDATQRAFLDDPVLRLPPGVWHLYAAMSWSLVDNGCDTEFTELRPEIEIEVLPATNPTDPPLPTFPGETPGPVTDAGGVEARQDDGTFEVRLASPKATWLAGEVIDVEVALTYLGTEPEVEVSSTVGLLGFAVVQLDGRNQAGTGGPEVCTQTTLWTGVPHRVPFDKGHAVLANPDAAWARAYDTDRSFRLTAGTWAIAAQLSAGPSGCDRDIHKFEPSIVIEVLDPVATGGPPGRGLNPTVEQLDWAAGVATAYATEHPETFAALWIDRPLLGHPRIGTSWTGDFEAHAAALQERIGHTVPFALYEAEYTDVELQRAWDQFESDIEWLDTLPAKALSRGAGGMVNRVEIDVSSAVPDVADRIREHYSSTFGLDPRMFVVTSDGTGAFFRPWGTVHAELALPPGGIPDGVELLPSWRSDLTGLECGGSDVGFAFEDIPCQQGRWTILVMAMRGDGPLEEIASGVVDVVAGQTANLTIEVERFP